MRAAPGHWRHSLRARLLAGTLIWIFLSVLAAGWLLSDLFRAHLQRQLENELALHMNELVAAFTVDEEGRATITSGPADPRLQLPFSGLYWQIDRLEPGKDPVTAVFRSRSLWDEQLDVPPTPLTDTAGDAARTASAKSIAGPRDDRLLASVRIVTTPEGNDAWRMIVAIDEHALEEPLTRFRRMLALSLGLLALGLTAAAIMQVLTGLRPLAFLRARLQEVRAGRSARIEGVFPSEIQPLVDEFNAVLQGSDEIIERARTQAGNLAHALKTPLSVLANAARTDDSPLGRLVAEQTGLAREQVEHHLARARAAAVHRRPGQRTEVAPVVAALLRTLARLHADRNLQVHQSGMVAGYAFRGEPQDLQEMLGNLLDNAFHWARGTLRITLSPQGADMLTIVIDDDGPGLSAAQREQVLQRGVRMDERVPGSGLGLSIARDLALAYGGDVQLFESPPGGLRVILSLPAA